MKWFTGFSLVYLVFAIVPLCAQNIQIETGLAIGNVTAEKHSLGKGELHLSLLKSYDFGILGVDFATGGNFIPGDRSTFEGSTETLSPSDSKFSSITILYRLPLKKNIFVEPRIGYASLFSLVHTDDQRKISQPNFSAGLGLGGYVKRFTFSFRYQYYGHTDDYQGTRDGTTVISNAEPFGLVLLRISYRFGLDKLFKKK